MEIGCGFRVREIKGHDYVYFWHYEPREGRSRQVHEYVGPTRASGTARRLVGLIDAYYARAGAQLARDLAGRRAAAMGVRRASQPAVMAERSHQETGRSW